MTAHDIAIEEPDDTAARGQRGRRTIRMAFAAIILIGAVVVSSQIMVSDGQAVVVTRFGDPLRVLTRPGLAWKVPAPIESTITVDLRLHTTSSGLEDVGTRDGLRILVQTFLAWRVAPDSAHIRQFLRSTGNNPDEAARQLRSFVGSALQVTAADFDLDDLVNTDPALVRLSRFEQQLQSNVARQVLDIYGVQIEQVGVQRLSLPSETLAATVARMRAERETVAAQRAAQGLRVAAQIRSDAERDARITIANAQSDAADIEAQSRQKAAAIYAASYARDPELYLLLRSLDTLNAVVGSRTRLILRTDAAPFDVLVQGPPIDFTAKAMPEAAPKATLPKGGQPDGAAASVMGLLDQRHGTGAP
jgi:modulator of FtsH protease HflC